MIDIEPIKERLKAAGYVAGLLQEYEFEDNTSDADATIHELIDNTNALISEVERLRERIKRYQGKLVGVDLVVPITQMHAWDEGYNAGKRDYAASIGAGASIVTNNPYLGLSLGCRHD